MFLGDKIRRLRLERGISQELLARLALTSTRTIARIEAREVTPRPATLSRIAVALGVEPDFFVLWTSDRPSWRKRATRTQARNRELVSA
jgi:transcriptional regulator with XRE-family HTH domain